MGDLRAHFQELADEELLRAVNVEFAQYRDEALTIARAEALQRGLEVRETATNHTTDSEVLRLLPAVSITSLVTLQVVTLGFYLLYWLYRNWRTVAQTSAENLSPVARVFFAPLFVHELFREIRLNSTKAKAARMWPPALLTALFLLANLTAALTSADLAWWIVAQSLFTLSITLAQIEINGTIQRATAPESALFDRPASSTAASRA